MARCSASLCSSSAVPAAAAAGTDRLGSDDADERAQGGDDDGGAHGDGRGWLFDGKFGTMTTRMTPAQRHRAVIRPQNDESSGSHCGGELVKLKYSGNAANI